MVYPHTYRTEHSETHTTNAVYGEYYAATKSKKIRIQPQLLDVIHYIDSNQAVFLDDLSEAVKIKSITSDLKYANEVKKMMNLTEKWLKKLDMKYELYNVGFRYVDGKKVRLPPVILASLGNDPKKKTICAYLHLDVPEPKDQKWNTDPWTLTNVNLKYHGNGAACGKGSLIMWFHAIQAFKQSRIPLPVNVKFIIESMKHLRSQGLADFVATRSQDFFAPVELVIECDSEWMGNNIPCIIYGAVGICHYQVTLEKTDNSQTQIKDDITKLFDDIVDDNGEIKIKGLNDYIEQITPDEEKVYENIREFDPDEIRDLLPTHQKSWDKVKLLMSFWRLPSIFIDDIEECTCEKQDKTIVKRNFILKLVPRQTIDRIDKLVKQHFQTKSKKLNIENKTTLKLITSTRPWFENHRTPAYLAARKAIVQIYKEEPNLIREDGGRETATVFDNVLEKNVIVIPLCEKGSNLGGSNEYIVAKNFFEGTKFIAAYLMQLGQIGEEQQSEK